MRGKQGVPEKKHTLAAIVPLTIPQGTGESRRMEYLPALLAYISKISTLTYKKTGLREASQQGQFFIPPPHGRGIFFAKIKCKMGCKKAAGGGGGLFVLNKKKKHKRVEKYIMFLFKKKNIIFLLNSRGVCSL